MNIFALDQSPKLSATYHTDKHVVKMILESAQMLSTAHRIIEGDTISKEKDAILYKVAHKNHPCSIWVRASLENYMWLYELYDALLEEYTYRFGKTHLSSTLKQELSKAPNGIPSLGLTNFAQAMPDYCKKVSGVNAYRFYYFVEKGHLFHWTKRDVPDWLSPKSEHFCLLGE